MKRGSLLLVHDALPHPLIAAASALSALPAAWPLADALATDVTSPVSIFITSAETAAGVRCEGGCREHQSGDNYEAEDSPHLFLSKPETSNRAAIFHVSHFQRDSMKVVEPERKDCAKGRGLAQILRDFSGVRPDFKLLRETPE